ncbi:hypothetical protein AA313_de0206083 [Arthrobotrys entomopaga]|nr:hypothetical protein AA313_de0206083 [Arthrobotrys entomopaga]
MAQFKVIEINSLLQDREPVSTGFQLDWSIHGEPPFWTPKTKPISDDQPKFSPTPVAFKIIPGSPTITIPIKLKFSYTVPQNFRGGQIAFIGTGPAGATLTTSITIPPSGDDFEASNFTFTLPFAAVSPFSLQGTWKWLLTATAPNGATIASTADTDTLLEMYFFLGDRYYPYHTTELLRFVILPAEEIVTKHMGKTDLREAYIQSISKKIWELGGKSFQFDCRKSMTGDPALVRLLDNGTLRDFRIEGFLSKQDDVLFCNDTDLSVMVAACCYSLGYSGARPEDGQASNMVE